MVSLGLVHNLDGVYLRVVFARNEAEYQKTLMLNPNDAQVDYWMGTVIASEKKLDPSSALFSMSGATRCTRN